MKNISKIMAIFLCALIISLSFPLGIFASGSVPPDSSSIVDDNSFADDSSADTENSSSQDGTPEDIPEPQNGDIHLVAEDIQVKQGDDLFRLIAGVMVMQDREYIDGYNISVVDTGGFDVMVCGIYTVVYTATKEGSTDLSAIRKVEVVQNNPDEGARGFVQFDANGLPYFEVDVEYEGKAAYSRGTRSVERIAFSRSSDYSFQGLQEYPGATIWLPSEPWNSYVLASTGERAYCVEPGVYDEMSGSIINYEGGSNGGAIWNALSEQQRVLITLAQYYGRLNGDAGSHAVTIVIQSLIWEIALNYVSWVNIPYYLSDLAGSNWLSHHGAADPYGLQNARSPYNTVIALNGLTSLYNSIVAQIGKHYLIPDFMKHRSALALLDQNLLRLPMPTFNKDGTHTETTPLVINTDAGVLATMNLANLTQDNINIRVDASQANVGILRIWAKRPVSIEAPYCPSPTASKIGFENPSPVTMLLTGTLPSGNPAQTKMVVRQPDPLFAFAAFTTSYNTREGFNVFKRDAETGADISSLPMLFRIDGPAGFPRWEGDMPAYFTLVPSGNYTISELEAPYGYVLASQSSKNVTITDNTVYQFPWDNVRQYGQIIIHKVDKQVQDECATMPSGLSREEQLAYLADKKIFIFPYAYQSHIPIDELPQGDATFKGAVFEIRAAEDIIAPQRQDGASLATRPLQSYEILVHKKGDLVQTIETGADTEALDSYGQPIAGQYVTVAEDGTVLEDNIAISAKLNLGKYTIKETVLPDGYYHEDYAEEGQIIEVTNDYTTQEVKTNIFHKDYGNIPKGGEVEIAKIDQLIKGGTGERQGVHWAKYGIYHARTKQLVDTFNTDINGWAKSNFFLPYGTYYVQEIEASPHYYWSSEQFFFFAGQNLKDGELFSFTQFDVMQQPMLGEMIVTYFPPKPRWKFGNEEDVVIIETPQTGVDE